jgi:hypothetical protein
MARTLEDFQMTRPSIAWLANPIVRLLTVISVFLLLAACGPGGDGGGAY